MPNSPGKGDAEVVALAAIMAEFTLPAGLHGSGRRRYAAAMGLYRRGQLSEELLEIYRTLAMDDQADPVAERERCGLG